MKIYRAVYYGWEGIEEEHFFKTEELANQFINKNKRKYPKRFHLECEEIEVIENQEELQKYAKEWLTT
jgi:hypothetical protein